MIFIGALGIISALVIVRELVNMVVSNYVRESHVLFGAVIVFVFCALLSFVSFIIS